MPVKRRKGTEKLYSIEAQFLRKKSEISARMLENAEISKWLIDT